ncbi:unnamed protein product [Boreogadus saida]
MVMMMMEQTASCRFACGVTRPFIEPVDRGAPRLSLLQPFVLREGRSHDTLGPENATAPLAAGHLTADGQACTRSHTHNRVISRAPRGLSEGEAESGTLNNRLSSAAAARARRKRGVSESKQPSITLHSQGLSLRRVGDHDA